MKRKEIESARDNDLAPADGHALKMAREEWVAAKERREMLSARLAKENPTGARRREMVMEIREATRLENEACNRLLREREQALRSRMEFAKEHLLLISGELEQVTRRQKLAAGL